MYYNENVSDTNKMKKKLVSQKWTHYVVANHTNSSNQQKKKKTFFLNS